MQRLIFILTYPIFKGISKLPFSILYLLSDGIYLLLFYGIGYRKKLVTNNLKLAFPDKSKKEIWVIKKKFYKHMCDMFMEMIKTMGMDFTEMKQHFRLTNPEVINDLAAKNRSIILLAGHYASWEWLLGLNGDLTPKAFGIYQKLSNTHFDHLVKNIRSKFGTTLINARQSREIIANLVKNKVCFVLGIAGDQSPMLNRQRHWTSFMGVRVPVHVGGELLAKEHDVVPVFLKVRKLERGQYEATFKVLSETPKLVPDFEITETFLKELEKCIYEAPEYYLWTHKRWKHKGKEAANLAKAAN